MPPETTTYAKALNSALAAILDADDRVFLMGQDIGVYGGAFGVSDGLIGRFGAERVRDTPISEDAIVGAGVGAAITGLLPIVEIQFSDFVVNAMDPLVNQAAKLHFMYGGRTNVPLVVRAPGGGGTGAAAQHSQSLEAWFAHIPGLKVVLPAMAQDAHDLLIAAVRDPNPVVFLEHKLLYKTEGPFQATDVANPVAKLGESRMVREGSDLTIAAYSIMTIRALEGADQLAEDGIEVEVIDLRTLRPLDIEPVRDSVKRTGHLVVAHEAPVAGGVGAEVVAGVVESDTLDYLLSPVRRVGGMDVPMPYAKDLEAAAIPQPEDVVDAVQKVLKS